MVSARDSAEFAARLPGRALHWSEMPKPAPRSLVVEVRADIVSAVLQVSGIELAAIRSSTAPLRRDVPGLTARLELTHTALDAPNAVGVLPGADPVLRREYVVISAHMDHIGVVTGQADSINNGADDDASGTAGVMELAEAFGALERRPRRSLVFVAFSGEENGLWGSEYFVEHPPAGVERMVANINLDMIGRNAPDTIIAVGREHSSLGESLDRVTAAHPELGIVPVPDPHPERRYFYRSDHYNFAVKGVPVVFFSSGEHDDYHKVSDSPDKIDADKIARLMRLVYHLVDDVANADAAPRWKPESYAAIVDSASKH
jgi:Zn-dependent M28 family amino/carboxypeptidase